MTNRFIGLAGVAILGFALCLAWPSTANSDGETRSKDVGEIKGTIRVRGVRSARDIVVYLEKVGNGRFAPPDKPVEMHQKGLAFQPRVLAILKGTTVDFLNEDNVLHNVFSPDDVMDEKDLGAFGKGEKRSFTFKKAGVATILCKIHPDMEATIVVLETPYFAVSEGPERGTEGTFTIKGVPPGSYTLKTWHERLKEGTAHVTVKAGEETAVSLDLAR